MTPRTPTPTPVPPRILLVEDDPASRAFLAAAAGSLPALVVEVTGCVQAMAAAGCEPAFDLWLVDAQLGDGDGATLLAALRAAQPGTPALAHTASRDPAVLARLRAAGFDAVISKPLPAAELREALRALLRGAGHDWDDAGALDALNGNPAHVAGLRRLFLAELPGQRAAVSRALADGDAGAARTVLHRMRASCGFVGAARLGDAVQLLEAAPADPGALARFEAAAAALLAGARSYNEACASPASPPSSCIPGRGGKPAC